MTLITINVDDITLTAELNDTVTAGKIAASLPFEGSANTWGDEIYFEIPVTAELENDAREDVEVGDLGYWPVGKAFCIFFGPTPVSDGDRPRAASPVNVFGKVNGEATVLKKIKSGSTVRVEAQRNK